MNTNEIQIETVRLPLWRACLEDMIEDGVNYGKTYAAEFFEEKLRCKRDGMEFGLAMSEIRRELETQGKYLSGRGQKGNQFVILPPESNADVMRGYVASAHDSMRRAVTLGTTTNRELMNDEQRRKHDSICEKAATKLALMGRSRAISSAIRKTNPKLLT
jgi:hypothetical protein